MDSRARVPPAPAPPRRTPPGSRTRDQREERDAPGAGAARRSSRSGRSATAGSLVEAARGPWREYTSPHSRWGAGLCGARRFPAPGRGRPSGSSRGERRSVAEAERRLDLERVGRRGREQLVEVRGEVAGTGDRFVLALLGPHRVDRRARAPLPPQHGVHPERRQVEIRVVEGEGGRAAPGSTV